LNFDGYILLADFGLAKIKEDEEEPNSFCGTPEYLCIIVTSYSRII
jgi:serine/threonine protein kinase